MKYLLQFTFVELFICFLFSCRREKPDCGNPYTRMNEHMADYVFNDSSCWIYENTSTLAIDSQVVFRSRRYKRPIGKPATGCEVPLAYEWNSFIEQHSNGEIDSFAITALPPYRLYFFSRPFDFPIAFPIPTLFRMQVFDLDLVLGHDTGNITFLQQHPFLQVGDSIYYNVSVFRVSAPIQSVAEFRYEMDLYFVPKVGIVRRVEYGTPTGIQTWDLKRYKAIPVPDNKYQ